MDGHEFVYYIEFTIDFIEKRRGIAMSVEEKRKLILRKMRKYRI
jgi:hypothetical protein